MSNNFDITTQVLTELQELSSVMLSLIQTINCHIINLHALQLQTTKAPNLADDINQ